MWPGLPFPTTVRVIVPRRLGDAVLSKSPIGMANEVLAKVLCHNVVVVGQAICDFGVEPNLATRTIPA